MSWIEERYSTVFPHGIEDWGGRKQLTLCQIVGMMTFYKELCRKWPRQSQKYPLHFYVWGVERVFARSKTVLMYMACNSMFSFRMSMFFVLSGSKGWLLYKARRWLNDICRGKEFVYSTGFFVNVAVNGLYTEVTDWCTKDAAQSVGIWLSHR